METSVPRCVLLRHDLPDGSWHYDWMIQRAGHGADQRGVLLTFRVWVRIDSPPAGKDRVHHVSAAQDLGNFVAIRLGDHRIEYLEYEGALSDGRGNVRRVACGRVTALTETDQTLEVTLDWGGGARRLVGRHAVARDGEDSMAEGGRWVFRTGA